MGEEHIIMPHKAEPLTGTSVAGGVAAVPPLSCTKPWASGTSGLMVLCLLSSSLPTATPITWRQTAKQFWQTWPRLLQLQLSPDAAAAPLSSCAPGRHSTAAGHWNPGQRDRPGPAASAGESGRGNRNVTQQQLKSNRQLIQHHAGRTSHHPVKPLVLSQLVKRKTLGWKKPSFPEGSSTVRHLSGLAPWWSRG